MRAIRNLALGIALFSLWAGDGAAQEQLDRTVLPIAEPKPPTYSELDARNAKPPPRFEVKAPRGAPNVVIVLIDDIGFGGPSTFGGPIRTPTMDRLAQSGLRFNNFHTTALCSPTRVALKSGRNHHTANAGSIMETATAFPVKITRFIPTQDGGSQFVEADIPIDNAATDAFGHLIHRSAVLPAQSTMLTEMPEGLNQDWHPASRRQLVVVLSGTVEVETSDGSRKRWSNGEMFLADDAGSRGHRTRAIGGPARVLFVHLPPDLSISG